MVANAPAQGGAITRGNGSPSPSASPSLSRISARLAGRTQPQIALDMLHAEEHPNGGGSIETTRRLVVQGRHDDIFICELSAKRDNREPLSDFEKSVLRKIARRNLRLLRRLLRPR